MEKLALEAENAQSRYERLSALETATADMFKPEIDSFDHTAWKNDLLSMADVFLKMPFIKEQTPVYFLENAPSLQQVFSGVQEGLLQADTAVASICALLGIHLSASAAHLPHLKQLLDLIRKNNVILQKWLTDDLSGVQTAAEEAKAKTDRLLETKSKILTDWERDILALDYSPMLLRYKTEYTGPFKMFKPQYRRDKKQLRALSRTIIKNITDEDASSLLLTLKDYHEQEAWFEDKQAELSAALPSYYSSAQTDWDAVLAALETARKLKEFPQEYLSDTLTVALSKDHADLISSLEALIAQAEAAFSLIHASIGETPVELPCDSPDFNAADAAAVAGEYLSHLSLIGERTALIAPCLRRADTPPRDIFRAVGDLHAHEELLVSLRSDEKTLRQHFGVHFADRQTNWADLKALLGKVRALSQFEIYESIRPIVNAEPSRKQEFSAIAQEITNIHASARPSFDWITSQFDPSSFSGEMCIRLLHEKARRCIETLPMLGSWIDYQEAKEDCRNNGLADFIEKSRPRRSLPISTRSS